MYNDSSLGLSCGRFFTLDVYIMVRLAQRFERTEEEALFIAVVSVDMVRNGGFRDRAFLLASLT